MQAIFNIEKIFSISPGYNGYREKILAYWDIEKKFTFSQVQYFIGYYIYNCFN